MKFLQLTAQRSRMAYEIRSRTPGKVPPETKASEMWTFEFFAGRLIIISLIFYTAFLPTYSFAEPQWSYSSNWRVTPPDPISHGDNEMRWSFGLCNSSGCISDLESDTAVLRSSADVNTDSAEDSTAYNPLLARRGIQFSGSPTGWYVTVGSTLRGRIALLDDGLFGGSVNPRASVDALFGLGSAAATGIHYNFSTARNYDDSRSKTIFVPDGQYFLTAWLITAASIEQCVTCVGPLASSDFFISTLERGLYGHIESVKPANPLCTVNQMGRDASGKTFVNMTAENRARGLEAIKVQDLVNGEVVIDGKSRSRGEVIQLNGTKLPVMVEVTDEGDRNNEFRVDLGIDDGTGASACDVLRDVITYAPLGVQYSYNYKANPTSTDTGGLFTIVATFDNSSTGARPVPLTDIYFTVTEISEHATLLNVNEGNGKAGSKIFVNLGGDNVLGPGEKFSLSFQINLTKTAPFRFFADAIGVAAGPWAESPPTVAALE